MVADEDQLQQIVFDLVFDCRVEVRYERLVLEVEDRVFAFAPFGSVEVVDGLPFGDRHQLRVWVFWDV